MDSAIENKPIFIFGDGLQTRTFCYVTDNVDFTISTLLNKQALNETINVGNNQEITIVSSSKIGIIGVGEGSTEHWKFFMDMCNIPLAELLIETMATHKNGIRY